MSTNLVKGGVAFIAWTLFSFYAHFFARSAIKGIRDTNNPTTGTPQPDTQRQTLQVWFAITTLTIFQLLVGSVVLFLLPRISPKRMLDFLGLAGDDTQANKIPNGTTGDSADDMPSPGRFATTTLAISHLTATICTNASIGLTDASSAFTVKAFEPITTAVLSSMLTGKRLETTSIIALPLVVAGSIGFCWHPNMKSSESFGLTLAFLSNVLFGLRNITLKQMFFGSPLGKLQVLGNMSVLAALLLSVVEFIQFIQEPLLITKYIDKKLLTPSLVSSVCHVTYTMISTCLILKYISVVAHSMANLLKRVLVALLFFILGRHVLLTINWLSALVVVAGLIVYISPGLSKNKHCTDQQSLILTTILSAIVASAAFFHAHSNSPSSSPVIHYSIFGKPLTFPISQSPRIPRGYTHTNYTPEELRFLKEDLVDNPIRADFLSKRLRTTEEVIAEAQRIQMQVYSKVIGKYKKAVLVNVFQWANKGDHFITIGQRLILERMNISLIYFCHYPGTNCDFSNIERSDDLVVMIQGAGYIGHPAHMFVVNKTVTSFPNNRVVMFPTSVCYPTPGCGAMKEFGQIYSQHKDAYIMLRDRPSFDMATHFFQKHNHLLLVPDSAFAAGPLKINMLPTYDIIYIKRNDWENPGFDKPPTFPPGVKYLITDWIEDWMKQEEKDFFDTDQLTAMSGVLFLSRAHVIITDRLHAHIISTLLGKPNVVVNSATRKQGNYYYTWEKRIQTSFLAHSTQQAIEKAMILLGRHKKIV